MHGLHVSPEGNGDNVFVSVEPGSTFDDEYKLPEDHPPGVYWYHSHHHSMVANQIFAGLFGAIIVEDPEPIEASAERVLVISDTTQAFHHQWQGIQRGQNRHHGSGQECGGMDADCQGTNKATWKDVVNVPANGRVKVRLAFRTSAAARPTTATSWTTKTSA